MISQDIGLKYLIPKAIEILKSNILAQGDFYEGDILSAVLSSDKKYWLGEKANWNTIKSLYETNEKMRWDFDTTWEIKKQWRALFQEFKEIHV